MGECLITFLPKNTPQVLKIISPLFGGNSVVQDSLLIPTFHQKAITSEQLISDTLEVTNYLRYRFGKEKIYLMGHSGGTFIGIQAAAQAPELYYAYIGIAQMSNQLESERLAYEYMLQEVQ